MAGIVLFIAGTMSCKKSDETSDDNGTKTEVSDNLHISFKTPDWERTIDCTHLDFNPMSTTLGVYFVGGSSESTKQSFQFSYPEDSSAIVAPSNLKKYPIFTYGTNDRPFQFSQKLPLTSGSADRLISTPGFSNDEFVEVTQVKHVGSTATNALFQIKGKYSMKAYLLSDTAQKKLVTGTFHIKIKTTKK